MLKDNEIKSNSFSLLRSNSGTLCPLFSRWDATGFFGEAAETIWIFTGDFLLLNPSCSSSPQKPVCKKTKFPSLQKKTCSTQKPARVTALTNIPLFLKGSVPDKGRYPGEGKNFFSREKKFFPSPEPPSFFKKSGVLYVWAKLLL